jgi:hypothetical protein
MSEDGDSYRHGNEDEREQPDGIEDGEPERLTRGARLCGLARHDCGPDGKKKESRSGPGCGRQPFQLLALAAVGAAEALNQAQGAAEKADWDQREDDVDGARSECTNGVDSERVGDVRQRPVISEGFLGRR